jgi:peptidoglycan/LPS O-acetylase OafA/YrhL
VAVEPKLLGTEQIFPELVSSARFGWLGAEIFFIISGVVIMESAERSSASVFLRNRILRLYPALWICATITFLLVSSLQYGPFWKLVRIWFLSALLYPLPPWIDSAYWTLPIEVIFYALIFMMLAFRQNRRLEYMIIALGLASSLYWVIGYMFAPQLMFKNVVDRELYLTPLMYGCFFCIGAMIHNLFRKGWTVARIGLLVLFITAALIEIGCKTLFVEVALNIGGGPLGGQIILVIAVLFVFLSLKAPVGNNPSRARIVRTIGLATYPLYLLHQYVGEILMKIILNNGGARYFALASAIIFCTALSFIITLFIEPKLREGLRRLLLRVEILQ